MYQGDEEDRIYGGKPGDAGGSTGAGLHRRESFFLHIRPRSYREEAVSFANTSYLGFLAVFFLVLECLTGLVLMVYYSPTPDTAYASILRINNEVPFGWLARDLHRLCGELMIGVVLLHMVRVYLAGSYHGKSALTWITGVALLICTLLLGFSGYLLPWDQLAYWAVTIGTSLLQTIPIFGDTALFLLRGGAEFGGDGLLRFYLLHIAGIPTVLFIFLAIHYYRVSRIHGISLPMRKRRRREQGQPASQNRVNLPAQMMRELSLSFWILSVLILVVLLVYSAPLENHADPRSTPSAVQAPWFFLWLQGALKYGDSFLMGICLPLGICVLLFMLPKFDRTERKYFLRRPVALLCLFIITSVLLFFTITGKHDQGIHRDPVDNVFHQFIPDQSDSAFHGIGFSSLKIGMYQPEKKNIHDLNGDLQQLLSTFGQALHGLETVDGISEVTGLLLIEDFQENLKRVTMRISWREADTNKSREHIVYRHSGVGMRDRGWRRN